MSGGEEWGIALTICSIYCGMKTRSNNPTSKKADSSSDITDGSDLIRAGSADDPQESSPEDAQEDPQTEPEAPDAVGQNREYIMCVAKCTATLGGLFKKGRY